MKRIEEYFNNFPLLKGFAKSWDWLNEVNHCNPFYSPLYYIICRGLKAKNIVEVGCEHGYSSYMLATAAKENNGTYFCIEKSGNHARRIKKGLVEEGFPHKVIWADTKDIKKFEWAKGVDFVLLDGEHTKESIEHEFELFYPILQGYIVLHDIHAWSAEGFYSIVKNPKYDLEYITFPYNYGMTLFKKRHPDEEKFMKERAEGAKKSTQDRGWCQTGGDEQKPGEIVIL